MLFKANQCIKRKADYKNAAIRKLNARNYDHRRGVQYFATPNRVGGNAAQADQIVERR